jgi:hypothetical protein
MALKDSQVRLSLFSTTILAGQLITLFSATDYCGRHKNAGAVLILKRNFEIIPKLIYP